MPLSITQRLTLSVAILGAAILAPTCFALYRASARGVEARALEAVGTESLALNLAIVNQLDEDILVDFVPRRVDYGALYLPFDHWAVMRRDGTVEAAHGFFEDAAFESLGTAPRIERQADGCVFSLASRPLLQEGKEVWDDVPAKLRDRMLSYAQGGSFLNIKKERSGDLDLFIGKWLFPDHVLELEMAETGELIDSETGKLPDRLPAGMEARTGMGERLRGLRLVGWRAHQHRLIAIVEGESPQGDTVRAAVNALGEQYGLRANGILDPMHEASRLWIVVAHDLSTDFSDTRRWGWMVATAGMGLWLFIIGMTQQVTRRALQPVKAMVTQAQRIDASQLDVRLPVQPVDDELSQVARTVNKMLDRIEAGYHRERQFTGDASHEMRNPLAKMIAEIDLTLERPRRPQAYQDTLRRLRVYALGMQHLTESLLTLTRLDGGLQPLESRPFDVAELAMEILKPFSLDSARRIRLDLGQNSKPIQAVGHRHLVGVMLSNLVDNGLRYSPVERPVFLRVNKNCKTVRFEVEDEGPGIPEEQVALSFHRFYRLDASRSQETGGLGLGLSIVQAIARLHQVEVTLQKKGRQGTCAAFSLPCVTLEAM